MDTGPVQGKEAKGPDNSREVQHLPFCRLQRARPRPAKARLHRKREDDGDSREDGGGYYIMEKTFV